MIMDKNNYKKMFSNFNFPILIIWANFEAIYTNRYFEKEIQRHRISTNLILQNPEFRINIEKMRNNLNITSEFSLIADGTVVFLRIMISKIEEIPIPNKKDENELLRMGISEKGNSEILPKQVNQQSFKEWKV